MGTKVSLMRALITNIKLTLQPNPDEQTAAQIVMKWD
jgi:hypothetical protein